MSENPDNRKVFLITGTSRGIGRYLIEYYVNLGHRVVGCSRGKIDFQNELYTHFETDISEEKNIIEITKFIRKDIKMLDVLINNSTSNPSFISSALLPYSKIEDAYKVNVFSPMVFCREAIKIMMLSKFGRIINIGSMVTSHVDFGGVLYSSSKAAINTYTRVLANEVHKSGITVNVVAPSAVVTDLSQNSNQEALMEVLSRNVIKRYGEMQDISNVIDLLIKKESSALTGQVIYLGGV